MSDNYFIEKRTQLEYRKEKFKKEHQYIPDYSKDPYGNEGTVVGDDGKRVKFRFSGGTTKRTPYNKKVLNNDKVAQYKYSDQRTNGTIEIPNVIFNLKNPQSHNAAFNHEYGHKKIFDRKEALKKDMRGNIRSASAARVSLSDQSAPYLKKLNDHDSKDDEMFADANARINTKNYDKAMKTELDFYNKYSKNDYDKRYGKHAKISNSQKRFNKLNPIGVCVREKIKKTREQNRISGDARRKIVKRTSTDPDIVNYLQGQK